MSRKEKWYVRLGRAFSSLYTFLFNVAPTIWYIIACNVFLWHGLMEGLLCVLVAEAVILNRRMSEAEIIVRDEEA